MNLFFIRAGEICCPEMGHSLRSFFFSRRRLSSQASISNIVKHRLRVLNRRRRPRFLPGDDWFSAHDTYLQPEEQEDVKTEC